MVQSLNALATAWLHVASHAVLPYGDQVYSSCSALDLVELNKLADWLLLLLALDAQGTLAYPADADVHSTLDAQLLLLLALDAQMLATLAYPADADAHSTLDAQLLLLLALDAQVLATLAYPADVDAHSTLDAQLLLLLALDAQGKLAYPADADVHSTLPGVEHGQYALAYVYSIHFDQSHHHH